MGKVVPWIGVVLRILLMLVFLIPTVLCFLLYFGIRWTAHRICFLWNLVRAGVPLSTAIRI